METNKEHFYAQSGNALIYVLIAIVLFAALSFTLARQTDTNEAGYLSDEKAELYATQIISYAAQAKSAIDQMLFTGTDIDDLDFTDPSDAGFNSGTQLDRTYRVFHPEGGGLTKGRLPSEAVTNAITDPPAGWYVGRFNTVEWTESTAQDVILVAYQIKQAVCEKINEKITGSTAIPLMTDSIKETMIDDSFYTGTNIDLTTDPSGSPICSPCHEVASLCVHNQAQNAYAFYTILADQ
ncbi:MAG: hypothetical protein ACPGRX_02860 [Bdellovibrionales bacterium]